MPPPPNEDLVDKGKEIEGLDDAGLTLSEHNSQNLYSDHSHDGHQTVPFNADQNQSETQKLNGKLIDENDSVHEFVKEAGTAKADNNQVTQQMDTISKDLGYQHLVAIAHEIKTVRTERELRMKETLAMKQADWDSMIKTTAWAKEVIEEVISSHLTEEDWRTTEEIYIELESFHDRLITIYGPPSSSLTGQPQFTFSSIDKSPHLRPQPIPFIPKFILHEYRSSILNLIALFLKESNLPGHYLHAKIAWNQSILEILLYLVKYELIDSEIQQSFEDYLKTIDGLKFIVNQSHLVFEYDTRYWNKLHNDLNHIEFLQNHPQLTPYGEIFKRLGKREQDCFMFYRLKVLMDESYRVSFPLRRVNPNNTVFRTPIQVTWHTNFMDKIEEILVKEFEKPSTSYSENKELGKPEDDHGFSQVKAYLIKIKDFLILPVIIPEIDNKHLEQITKFSFAILELSKRKYDDRHVEGLGLSNELDPATINFKRNNEFIEKISKMEVWKTIFLDYGWFLLEEFNHGRQIPLNTWENEGSIYWIKLRESVNDYKQFLIREFKKDPEWKSNFLESNQFFDFTKKLWDIESQNIDWFYVIFHKILRRKNRSRHLDLPMEMFTDDFYRE
ncbi:hypothetical protein Pst134EB_031048 [Puccinia striiformis f. sp. tritici]|nr:hypothetical protein Pst134EB_031048 [Puccinia striiformis f. sp. tritici]